MSLFLQNKKIATCLIIVCLLTILTTYNHTAHAETINESESNDTWSTGDATVDGANNYGTLPDADDIDWWHVTFSKSGYAHYWINAPSGCNYYMRLYDGDVNLLEKGGTAGRQELIRFAVKAGKTYRIRIATTSTHSNSTYRFIAKWYPIERVYPFVYNTNIDTRFTDTTAMTDLWNMGYTGTTYLNNIASTVLSSLPKSDVLIFNHHGAPGIIQCGTAGNPSFLYAKNGSLNIHDSSSLKANLVIWGGCDTGSTSSSYGNLVDETLAKGAKCAIGWTNTIYSPYSTYWIEAFIASCEQSEKISTAIDDACSVIEERYSGDEFDYLVEAFNSYYTGSSNLNQVIG